MINNNKIQKKFSVGELVTSRIKNGEESKAAEFPHHVAIRRNSKYLCGGSILDELHIIVSIIYLFIYYN